MKAWSDEWRCANLRLHLRAKQLFQGETVNVQVCADVMPASGSSGAHRTKHEGLERPEQLLQRWRGHCEGAHVQIQVVQVSQTDPHASSSTPSPGTLFRQETQLSHVSVDAAEHGVGAVVKMDAQFDLKVRHEFWERQVLLIVHVMPKSSVVDGVEGVKEPGAFDLGLRGSLGASLLKDEWANSQLLSLTREEAQPTPSMIRRVEQRIVVTKPLQLEVETRELAGQRVGILARASNAHAALTLAVRDLQLHLDQSLRTQGTSDRGAGRFRVVSGDKVPFPVVLQPQERYNFLFVLEPVGLAVTDESQRGPKEAGYELAKKTKKGKSPVAAFSLQHTLLTLSWQALTVSMEAAILENRTIVWSPNPPSRPLDSLSSNEKEHPQADVQELVAYVLAGHLERGGEPYADFKCVRLLQDSALHTTVAPMSSSLSVGSAVTVCVTVANRSARTDFDLTLVLPSRKESALDGNAEAVVGFEASHRLGLIRPGMSARRSMHVAFLRVGKCRLGPLVLVDRLTRTCFMTDDWEVFINN